MAKVDVAFRITGTEIPADHGYHLFAAISRIVPELHADNDVGVWPISGRLVGNRRVALTELSRLTVRLVADRIGQILRLAGKQLDINGSVLRVGVPQTQTLIPAARLYSRLVIIKGFLEPKPFLEAARRQLEGLEIRGEPSLVHQSEIAAANREKVTGTRSPYLRRTIRIRDKEVVGFALYVQALSEKESIQLQEEGIGGRRRFGCGLFIPCEAETE